ncbi:MAG: phosphatase PAP2 family protein [Spirochaetes bacterium]|nr:phosphatase PAP2 family protein [Spirochaetota bacterium]
MTAFFQSHLFFGEEVLNGIHLFFGGWLDRGMYYITILGNESFYMVILPLLYWCYEKKRAMKIIVIFLVSSAINDLCKDLWHMPRPDAARLLPGIRELNIAYKPKSPGFPSGHTQGAVAFWGPIIWYFRHPAIICVGLALILLIPYSRLYLAVHFLGDVTGGYLIGIAILFIMIPATECFDRNREKFCEIVLVTTALVIPLVTFIIAPSNYVYPALGSLSGMLTGAVIANTRIDFNPRNSWYATVIKIVIGLSVLFVLKFGLKMILPSNETFGYIRYFILGIWCTLLAPLLFSRFRSLKGVNDGQ